MKHRESYFALIDSSTDVLLALSTDGSLIANATTYIPGSICMPHVDKPNYKKSFLWRNPFFIASLPEKEYPQWTWSLMKRVFTPTPVQALTKEIQQRSALAVSKIEILEKIRTHINIVREELRSGTYLDETVQHLRKEQALAYSAAPDSSERFPLVFQWASINHLTPQEAAEDMLLMTKISEEKLIRSEMLYQRHVANVRKATLQELPSIYEQFLRECYSNAIM